MGLGYNCETNLYNLHENILSAVLETCKITCTCQECLIEANICISKCIMKMLEHWLCDLSEIFTAHWEQTLSSC